jgi:hypothetical protein
MSDFLHAHASPFDGVHPEPFGYAQDKLRRRTQGEGHGTDLSFKSIFMVSGVEPCTLGQDPLCFPLSKPVLSKVEAGGIKEGLLFLCLSLKFSDYH